MNGEGTARSARAIGPGIAPLARDLPLRVTTVGVLACAAAAFLPVGGALRRQVVLIATPVLLAWILFWLLRRRRASTGEVRRFWGDLVLAVGTWLAGSLLLLGAGTPGVGVRMAIDIAYGVYSIALLRASDRELRGPVMTGVGRWTPAAIFVLGMLAYWVLLTAIVRPQTAAIDVSSRLLFATIDAYLTVRFALLARAAPRPSWRLVFGALAATTGGSLVHTLFRLADLPATASQPIWYLPFLTLMVAVRAAPQPAGGAGDGLQSSVRAPILAALLLPAIHFAGYGALDLLDPALRRPRELLAGGWVLAFGILAVLERRHLLHAIRSAAVERPRLVARQGSKGDLRMILERRRTDHAVSQSAEKYTRAFEICPDAIGISTADDGRFIEVNRAFEQLTGYRRERIIGRRSIDLGLWYDLRDRQQIIALVRRQGHAAGLTLPICTRTGARRLARFWAQPLDIDGQPCVIIVGRAADEAGVAEPAPLDLIAEPAMVVDRDGHVLASNPAAVARFGRQALTEEGGSLLFAADDQAGWPRLRDRLENDGAGRDQHVRGIALDRDAAPYLLVAAPSD